MKGQGDIGEKLAHYKALAEQPLSPEELAEHRSKVAAVKAADEARRSGATPQATLPLDEAA